LNLFKAGFSDAITSVFSLLILQKSF